MSDKYKPDGVFLWGWGKKKGAKLASRALQILL